MLPSIIYSQDEGTFANGTIRIVGGKIVFPNNFTLDSNGADTAVILTLENTGGSIDVFLSSASPEGVITGNLGDLTIVDTETGDIFAKVSGSGNTGWLSLTGGGKNYASIFADDNSTATEIALVNSWQKFTQFSDNHGDNISTSDQSNSRITVGAAGDYSVLMIGNGAPAGTGKTFEFNTFMLAATTTSITAATAADPVVISASGHGFSNGNKVAIKAAGGMVEINDRIFTVAGVSGADFNLQDDIPGNIDGTGFTTFTSGGTVQLAVEGHVHGDRKFAAADRGGFHGGVIETLILNDKIEVYVKNVTDATNFTIEGLSLTITKEN